MPVEHVSEVVATEPSVVARLVKYAKPDIAMDEVVAIWNPEACFALNVVQLAADRHPGIEPVATSHVTAPLA